MRQGRYRAFLSYSRVDATSARRVQRRLESYVLPKRVQIDGVSDKGDRRLLRPIFRDDDELVPGGLLPERISAALASSDFLIVLCSRAAAISEWVDREIATFLAMGGKDRLIAIVIDGEPNAEKRCLSPDLECLPPSLRGSEGGPNPSADVEHFWVDWRRNITSDRRPFIQLVAALLQLESVDELIQRDRQAIVRKRALSGAYASFGLLSLMAAAAFIWYLSLSIDSIQRHRLNIQMTDDWKLVSEEHKVHSSSVYTITLAGDINNDNIVDFIINDNFWTGCGSEGCDDRILIGNYFGGFDNISLPMLFFKYQDELSLSGNSTGWKAVIGTQRPNDPDFLPVTIISVYDEASRTYTEGARILCGPSGYCAFGANVLYFCPLDAASDRYIEQNFRSEERYISPPRGSDSSEDSDRLPLNPRRYDTKYGMVPIALSIDGKWLMYGDIVMPGPIYAERDQPAEAPKVPEICATALELERAGKNTYDRNTMQ